MSYKMKVIQSVGKRSEQCRNDERQHQIKCDIGKVPAKKKEGAKEKNKVNEKPLHKTK